MSSGLSVSIVIPAKDEQENIGSLITEIHTALGASGDYSSDYEVIVIDDGSADDTFGETLRTAEKLGCKARAIRHSASVGQSTAVLTGVKHAHGKLIVTMDGDGQNDPADVPDLLARARTMTTRHFCIAGYRKQRKDTPWKRFQSRLANRVRNSLLHDNVPDTGCGLKLFPKETFLNLPYFDHMHRFIPALVKSQGGQIEVVVVHHRDRLMGTSKYSAWNRAWVGIVDLLGVMWLQRRTKNPSIERVTDSGADD